MITRELQKKFTNISTVTLKRFGRRYELAIYPNTLYEFRTNPSMPLDEILHNKTIYKNVSTGDIASEADIALFSLPYDQICRVILSDGHEQKPTATTQHELQQIERQIVETLQSKLTYNGSYVPDNLLLKSIRAVSDIKNIEYKKQLTGIIKKLEQVGYERISYKVRCDSHKIEYNGINKYEGYIIVKSDILPGLIEYCERNGIVYVIERHETVKEEEIC